MFSQIIDNHVLCCIYVMMTLVDSCPVTWAEYHFSNNESCFEGDDEALSKSSDRRLGQGRDKALQLIREYQAIGHEIEKVTYLELEKCLNIAFQMLSSHL